MAGPAFLAPPGALLPADVVRGASAHVAETLAWAGHMDPAAWLAPDGKNRVRADRDVAVTGLHRVILPVAPGAQDRAVPTENDWARARAGDTWDEGPQADERMALWALSHASLPPETTFGLLLLALKQRWRFAMALLATPEHLPDDRADWTSLFGQALDSGWTTGIALLGQAYLQKEQALPNGALRLAHAWVGKLTTPKALDGILGALPLHWRDNDALWNGWMDTWTASINGKAGIPAACVPSLAALAVDRFAALPDPSPRQRETLDRAHRLDLACDHGHDAPKAVRRFARHWAQRDAGAAPPLAAALVSTLEPATTVHGWLHRARQAAACSAALSARAVGATCPDGERRADQARLHWLMKTATEHAATALQKTPERFRGERAQTQKAVDKRAARVERDTQMHGWTDAERLDALRALAPTPWREPLLRTGMAWVAALADRDASGWAFVHGTDAAAGALTHLLPHVTLADLPVALLDTWGRRLEEGAALPPALARGLWALAREQFPVRYFAPLSVRGAWDTPDPRAPAPALGLVGVLALLANRGMLPLRAADLEELGALEPLRERLHGCMLDGALEASAAPRTRPRM